MSVLGLEVVTARNTGTIGTPTWDVIGPIRDETLNMSMALADITTRLANGFRLQRGTLIEGSVDLGLLYLPGDADFDALQSAFFDRTQVILGLFDGDITVAGTYYGLHSAFNVTNFSQPRNLEDAVIVEVTLTLDVEDTTLEPPRWETLVVT